MSSRNIRIAIIVIFLLSLASFITIPYTSQILTRKLATPPQISRARDVIMERTNVGMQVTKDLINEAFDNGFISAFGLLSESEWETLQDQGLAVFLFKDDVLELWSENMDIGHVEELSNKLVKVQNTWCISYWIARDEIKGLLLVKLRYNYPYQNKFLQNEFHRSINFLKDYNLSPLPVEGSFPVALFGNAPVFYLSYIPRDFDEERENFVVILYHIGFSLLLLGIYCLFWLPFFRKRKAMSIILLILTLGGIRFSIMYWQIIPQGDWKIFSPEIFAYSWLTPSLGDLLINTVLVFGIIAYCFRTVRNSSLTSITQRKIVGFIFALASFIALFTTDSLISILVHNSTITLEAYRIFNLNIYTGLAYLIVSIWFISAILCAHCATRTMTSFPRRVRVSIWFAGLAFSLATVAPIAGLPSIYGTTLAVLVIGLIHYFYRSSKALNVNLFLALILLLSLYTVLLVSTNSEAKDKEIRKILAINLANERDPVAEVIFPQITRKMYADETILYYLDNISTHEGELYTHLNENYLNSYLKKYDFQITVCLSTSNIFLENTGEVLGCYDFFESMLNEYGMRIPGTSFFHLNNQNGRISYLGMIEYVLPDGDEICIYLELDSKLSHEVLGYPELLLDGKVTGRSIFSSYSSAKYFNGQLIARTGNFDYPLYNTHKADSASSYTFIDDKNFNHLMYTNDSEIELFLSRPKENLFNVTASFAWVFLFFYVTAIVWLLLGGLPVGFNFKVPSLKNRIRYTMVQLLFLSLIMVGMVTITYSVKGFESKNYDSLNEKLLSAKVDIEDNLVSQDALHPDYTEYLTHYLIKLSNVLRSDINLYSLSGELIATSRPEVFERQLIGTDMHPLSYYELSTKYSPKLIHTEQIGKMEYLSAYAPIFNNQNQIVAYLNLPYFTRQGEFMEEVFSVIVALVNIYALLILFAIFVAIVISNQISKPLELIREKLGTVNLDKHNETISYVGDDEVGQLVAEYNRMVGELAESAKKLAQSQRQSAWREMAKQIAHEIKNPLTPIKLNLQYLIRAKKNNQPDWDNLFEKFADSLIDQINSLSNIATEFSNFAKMPVGQFKHIVLNGIVNDAVNLFSAYPNIYVEKNIPDEEFPIYADKEQLSRVFVNLIKNAVQAIGRKEDGHLRVSVVKSEPNIRVIIEDNGTGIPDEVAQKLFTPNFTTKSGGMGLGLAISKGIIEVIGGRIWFETTPGLGTKFFVQLPITPKQ